MRLSGLASRSLASRPLRTTLTVIGVAVGVAIVVATLIANQASGEAIERAAQELVGRAAFRVRAFDPAGFTPRAVAAIRRIPGVRAAAAVGERRMTLSTPPGPDESVFGLLAVALDPDVEPAIRDPHLVAGSPLATADPTGVLLNAGWASDHGLTLGDEIRPADWVPGEPAFHVIGLVDDVGLGALERGAVLIVDRAQLDSMIAKPAPVVAVDVQTVDGHAADVEAALDRQLREPFVVETAADAATRFARAQAAFAPIAFLFGLVALVVGAFLVANTMAMTVGERVREIGLLRAAGTTSRQVLWLFARQGLLIGAAGSLLGIALGIGLAAGMISFLRATRAVLIDGLPLSPAALLLAAALGLGVTIAAAAVPALQAARTGPLDALRPSRRAGRSLGERLRWVAWLEVAVVALGLLLYPFERGQAPMLGIGMALAILLVGAFASAWLLLPIGRIVGPPIRVAIRRGGDARSREPRPRPRSHRADRGVARVALAAVVALGSVAASARETAARWIASVLPGGTAIRLALPDEIDLFRPTFTAIPGTRAASPIAEFPAVIGNGDVAREVSVAGIDPTVFQDAGSLIFTSGSRGAAFNALRDGRAVLVPQPMADRDGIGVGDSLSLSQPGGHATAFTVAGVIAYTLPAQSPDGALIVSLADAKDAFGVTTAGLWALVPAPGVTPAAFRSAVAETARSLAAEPVDAEQLAGDLARSFDRLIGLFDVLALVAVAVAAAGIVNSLGIGVVERAREISILRSHGMTVGQVQAMVVSEAAILGAVGGILAAGIGLAMAWAMVVGGGSRDFAAGLAVPWPLVISCVLLGTGVAALAGIYPARRAGRLPIVASLQHFE